jgi:hypothetical protein
MGLGREGGEFKKKGGGLFRRGWGRKGGEGVNCFR